MLNWNRAREKDFATKIMSRERIVRAVPSANALEARRCQVVANFFVNFPHNTVEETLVTLTAPTKKANLSWVPNVRKVIPQLQEQMSVRVKQDSRCTLSQLGKHCFDASHDHVSGRLDHKMRQASRFVQRCSKRAGAP